VKYPDVIVLLQTPHCFIKGAVVAAILYWLIG
jgi:hypothetical protein